MPKTFSAPAHSSDRMRLCAPVTGAAAPCSLMVPFLYRNVAPNKKPLGPGGQTRGDASAWGVSPSADAPSAYKEIETHGPTVVAARSEERRVGKDVVSRVDLGGRRIIK